jgi:serine/threonine protein phosphatase 1
MKYAASIASQTCIYAVGDIHGRWDLLVELHDLIRVHAQRYPDFQKKVIYLGDYIDRGPDSKRVLDELIRASLPDFTAVHLKGNHEAMLLAFLENAAQGNIWLFNGGIATLQSYGIRWSDKMPYSSQTLAKLQKALQQQLPQTHWGFLRSLQLYHIEGDFLFCHAGYKPKVPLADQAEQDLLWIRDEFLYSPLHHEKIIVHGHTISTQPEILPNRVGIDTGAFHTGILTAAAIVDSEIYFLQAQHES